MKQKSRLHASTQSGFKALNPSAGYDFRRGMELEEAHISETRVKRCRFVATAGKIRSEEEAKNFIEMVREKEANHNCWAYRINKDRYRYSDDGEPSGTGGKPIYGAICSSGVEQVVVVVSRFFGGVKLGTGGLARAYSKTAGKCLGEAGKRKIEKSVYLNVKVEWDKVGTVQGVIARLDRLETTCNADGCVIRVRVKEEERAQVEQQLMDASAGCVLVQVDDCSL